MINEGILFDELYKVSLRKRCGLFKEFLTKMEQQNHPNDNERQDWDLCSKI